MDMPEHHPTPPPMSIPERCQTTASFQKKVPVVPPLSVAILLLASLQSASSDPATIPSLSPSPSLPLPLSTLPQEEGEFENMHASINNNPNTKHPPPPSLPLLMLLQEEGEFENTYASINNNLNTKSPPSPPLPLSTLLQEEGEFEHTHASVNPNPKPPPPPPPPPTPLSFLLLAKEWVSDAVISHRHRNLSSAAAATSSSPSLFQQPCSGGNLLRQILFTGTSPPPPPPPPPSSRQSCGRLRQKLFMGIPPSSSSSSWQSFIHLRWKRIKLLNDVPCMGVQEHDRYEDACAFVKNTEACRSRGLIDYYGFFYCTCQRSPGLGYAALLLWLPVLFFMLAKTSASYFCCTLQGLSTLMRLSPAVSAVTLLALGNGAPDVFSGVAAFTGSGSSMQGSLLGVSGILGGAAFVTMLVSGSVSLVAGAGVRLDWRSVCRDVGFLFLAASALWWIISDGQVFLLEAFCFLSLYGVYATCVIATEAWDCCRRRGNTEGLLPQDTHQPSPPGRPIPQRGDNDDNINPRNERLMATIRHFRGLFYAYVIEFPLPLRLTIPIVEECRWHRPSAVTSLVLAPSLIALVWMGDFRSSQWIINATLLLVGVGLAALAYFTTKPDRPPQRLNSIWVFTGFAMSIMWFYLISQELLEVLVAMGTIFHINSSILALTLLAWGNSISDFVSNICLAREGEFGIRVAMSGCFAGPMFNVVVGLGICLLCASWESYPFAFILPDTIGINIIIIFLILGLVLKIITILAMRMEPSKTYGIMALCLYGSFIVIKLNQDLGWVWI